MGLPWGALNEFNNKKRPPAFAGGRESAVGCQCRMSALPTRQMIAPVDSDRVVTHTLQAWVREFHLSDAGGSPAESSFSANDLSLLSRHTLSQTSTSAAF